ncbi:MAG: hypothetical protein ACRCWF_09405 [Beijerinckiaceae bacterium]
MLDDAQKEKLEDALDVFMMEQSNFERIIRSIPIGLEELMQLGKDISRSSHASARKIISIAGNDPAEWAEAASQLRAHPVHREYLMQSDFIAQALRKPYGYAGDKDLMLMIYRNEDRGISPYAELKNHVYQSLPAAEAVRQRVDGMERHLRSLPDGARVLCLACGPGWEIQQLAQENNLRIQIDLLDHDRQTLNYTMNKLAVPGVNHILCNAFDIIKGQTSFEKLNHEKHSSHFRDAFRLKPDEYDLIYTTGLYDYIASFPMNPSRGATGLTTRLFSFLKPSGRLYVGNFLKPGGANPHQIPHQFMMEAYSDWKLIYRTLEDIQGFAAGLPAESYRSVLFDETIERAAGPESVIGFIELQKVV